MSPHEFDARIVDWARQQSDLEALIQIGSRVQSGAEVDEWSDWDFQLIVSDPSRYQHTGWLDDIAPCWCAHIDRTERGVLKLSAVLAGGIEVDLVPLAAWQMKLVYWAMAHPWAHSIFPKALIRGINRTQLIVRPGYRVVLGGDAWVRRLTALNAVWPVPGFTESDFRFNAAGFWRHAVWVQKKIMRGETRAALRWHQIELTKHRWAMLEEEAKLAGRPARPEARKAEKWLDARRLEQTAIETNTDQRVLARALLAEMTLFEEVSRNVAISRGWTVPDYTVVAGWLRHELTKLAGQP